MRRRVNNDININHERWLVSYADFVTLLFAFFVVMYSISQVSESKYRVLSETMTQIFNEPKRSLEPIQVGDVSRSGTTTPAAEENSNQKIESQGAFDKTADLPQLSDQFTEQFSDLIDDEVIQVNSNEYWLQISLSNSILFPLGSVNPTIEAKTVLSEVANLLDGFNNPIHVEGYTDNVSVNSVQFPSNWELSSARAASIVKLLVGEGIDEKRLAAVGYGEHHPIAENETPEGRAQNRRVVLMIAREKMKRPMISTQSEIKEAVDPAGREQTQVNPQPGLENNQTSLTDSNLSPKEKMDRLIESNPGLGIDSVLTLDDDLSTTEPDVNNEEGDQKIQAVETNKGGLLFSSDPDLPRSE
ncbi:MAG: flagellar motor protein MotD [Cellvibrionaceae bacterium]